nr:hybrid sensor histidine kinase/response regulator transcription factor [uncultured Pedobacter sp.]
MIKKSLFYFQFLSIVVLIFNGGSAYAQRPVLKFRHLTINEGLSQNTVFCTYQDHKGFIWVGTEDGLNRYDGVDWLIYKHELNDPKSLSNNQVNSIVEDENGNLLIATSDGLNIYHRDLENFSKINLKSTTDQKNDFITFLMKDANGEFWISSRDGLKLLDKNHKVKATYKYKSLVKGVNPYKVLSTFESKDHQLWVNTGTGLRLFDIKSKKFIALPKVIAQNSALTSDNVRTIKLTKSGNYWMGTESHGLFFYDVHQQTLKNYKASPEANGLLSNVVRDVFIYSENELWIGTREGLSVFNIAAGKFYNYTYDKYNQNSLSHNSVRNFLRDDAGSTWIGTYAGGLNIFNENSRNFSYLGEKIGANLGLNHRVVSSIIKEKDGSLWIGTEGGGLNYINLKTEINQYHTVLGNINNSNNIVKCMVDDGKGNLWLGTYNGISIYNKNTGTFADLLKSQNPQNPVEPYQVHDLVLKNDKAYIATNGKGLVIYANGKLKEFFYDVKKTNSISSNNLTSLLAVNENLWVGTQKGLNFYNPQSGTFTRFLHQEGNPQSISGNSVLCLFKDTKNRLWVGTEGGGLNLFNATNKTFGHITEKNGLANNVIHAIVEDNMGFLWVSTNKGLSKIDLRKYNVNANQELKITNYTVADGLQSNQFSNEAVAKGADGELLFGGINGVTFFHPNKIKSNNFKPKVVLTDFLIRNKEVNINTENSPLSKQIGETDEIVLSYDQAYITIKYAALNYINSEKNKYAYKLEGFADDDWNEVGNQHSATYTNLSAGTYVFKVKAANNDGVWNNEVRSLKIKVLPPFWKTWWAYLIYLFMIAGILYVYYIYSIRTAKLKNELAFEYKSHQKDQDLAQRKLSFFTNISHEIKTPLTLILAPIEKLVEMNAGNNIVQNQLSLMQRNGERLVRLINQLLDFRKFESGKMLLRAAEGNMVRFVKEVVMAFDSYAKYLKINLEVETEANSIRAYFDRDNFEKILYNLLSNSLKFTPEGGNIKITVSTEKLADQEKGFVCVAVQDDGKGIPEKYTDKIFEEFTHLDANGMNPLGTGIGLAFTKGLVNLHHGDISVQSREAKNDEKGFTKFTVKIPLGKAHFSSAEIIENYQNSENIDLYKIKDDNIGNSQIILKKKEEILKEAGADIPIMLIVEDNKDVRGFLEDHFKSSFVVHTAENGVIGLDKALELIPDIIISDVMMPEMSGTELCSKLKSAEATSHIPIILLTARTPLIYKIEGLETGADDYITKPFSLKIVEARVWNLLELRKQLRERYRKEVSFTPKNIAISSPDEKFIEKVMKFIEDNLGEPTLSVEELGKEIGMSRVTLYRKIKALTNQTTIEIIRTVRLKRAAQLLETGHYNVSEVAYMVGFADLDYFRKCFKEQFKKTPKDYSMVSNKE